MKREDDQQLWDLIGQAADPRKLVPAAGLAAAVIAAVLAVHRPPVRMPIEREPDVIATIDPQDYDVVADLDELLVTDESSLWDDDTQTL
jgi:hypothetical protein